MPKMNEEQIAFWNGRAGEVWASEQQVLDRTMAPLGDAAMARAAPAPGERVVDVGCGCGESTLALARAVGPRGRVLGVDVSEPMLAVARARGQAAKFEQLAFARADASTFAFDGDAGLTDLLFSRLGVMFFEEPVAAFTHLRRVLRPGGRLVFACWRAREENPWMTLPLTAAAPFAPLPPPTPAEEPGPFSLAEEGRIREVLARSGFESVAVGAWDHPLVLGATVLAATDFALKIGPAARLVADLDAATRARVRAAVEALLATKASSGGVSLAAAAWLVSARTPQPG